MTVPKCQLVTGLLLGLSAAVAYASAGTGAGNDGKKGSVVAAPLVRVVRVPSPRDGILLAVGTEAPKGAVAGTKGLFEVKLGKEVRRYLRLRVGDRIKQGQVLAQLDDRLARHEVSYKKAKVASAEAEHRAAAAMAKEAQARLDRLEQLKRTNPALVSADEYSAAVLTRDKHREEGVSKREQVKLFGIELEQALIILDTYTVRSPVAGVLSRIHKYRGEAARRLETVFEIQVPVDD
jgi:multidrug efflux pump subunit AcrA (membrane-fusion protein)